MNNLPNRTLDTMSEAIALSSPSGRMSKRSHKAAMKRLSIALFGPNGLQKEPLPQITKSEQLRNHVKMLRDLANSGMCVKKYNRIADLEEKEAEKLESLIA